MDRGAAQIDHAAHISCSGGETQGDGHAFNLSWIAQGGVNNRGTAAHRARHRVHVEAVREVSFDREASGQGEARRLPHHRGHGGSAAEVILFNQPRADETAGSNDGDFHEVVASDWLASWAWALSAAVSHGCSTRTR